MLESVLLIFSSKSFTVSDCIFKSLIDFEFIFVFISDVCLLLSFFLLYVPGCCKDLHNHLLTVGHLRKSTWTTDRMNTNGAERVAWLQYLKATLVLVWSWILVLIQKLPPKQPIRYWLGSGTELEVWPRASQVLIEWEPVGLLESPGQNVFMSQFKRDFFLVHLDFLPQAWSELNRLGDNIYYSISLSGIPSWFRWLRICLQCRRPGFDTWVRKIPWRRMATHSSILAWRIPGTEEPGELQSTGLQRV